MPDTFANGAKWISVSGLHEVELWREGTMLRKTEILFIRGCKSTDPVARLESIHRRFYLSANGVAGTICIMMALMEICEKYCPIPLNKLLADLQPESRWRFGLDEKAHFFDHAMRVLCFHIRHEPASKFEGITWPARHRRKPH